MPDPTKLSDPTNPAAPTPLADDRFHAIARALADPRRFAILQQIASADTVPCTAVTGQHPISPATISHHIRELTEAGLITAERHGRLMNLALHRPTWNAYLQRLAGL